MSSLKMQPHVYYLHDTLGLYFIVKPLYFMADIKASLHTYTPIADIQLPQLYFLGT